MAFERVAKLGDLPEQSGLCVTLGGRRIGIYRVGERVYAMENECPHAGLPLHEGVLDGTHIICNGHGWEFDLETGLAPGEVDEDPIPRFAVRVDGDDVLVDVETVLA